MFHHGQTDYQEAASKAAKQGREKMEAIIHKGQANAKAVVEGILARQIEDKVVKQKAVKIGHIGEIHQPWRIVVPPGKPDGTDSFDLHDHAFVQVLGDAGVPKRYADDLAGEGQWGRDLVAQNVNTIFARRDKRNLLRSEGGVVKGFLSDKYRRLDSRPLLDAFMGAAGGLGLVPIDGIGTDTKSRVRAVLPKVFEPVDNEVMIFGLEWGNSDYGDGGHVVNLWTMRVWCTNLAVTDRMLRQVHLGARLADDIAYSQRTYELDTKTNASALKDVVKQAIGPGRISSMLDAIRSASEEEIKGKDGVDAILKRHFEKPEAEKIKALYDGPDVQNLPPGKTVWRLSNAVSFFAQADGLSGDRKLELQTAAGKLIPHKEAEAVAV